ncbi:uncharacterized protein M6B38_303490 [Iris pallida]|uniref:Uncharacterized protein n=1 Tax=Iris pallida TaxID=29817 RepID=A0AAX6HLZ5_IRIPA|nr:uncharacterized protein M6B38_303490 [Iris pallida]
MSAEVSAQAAASAKVLMASSLPSNIGSTKESAGKGRLTLERYNGQASCSTPDREQPARFACGKSITPVTLHRQAVSTGTFAEGSDGNEAADSTLATKKKRKLWTEEEDKELIAAVQKYGEGNWVNILKGDFKHDRTASQLSQRWSILKKRPSNSNPGGANNSSNTTQSEAMLAVREAVSSALKMPMARSLPATCTGASVSLTQSNNAKISSTISEASPATTVSPPRASNSLPQPVNQAASHKGASTPQNNSQTTAKSKAAPKKPPVGPNPLIQAAAFAAGGRIVAPSTAATLLKAAQSKNVHIMNGGARLMPSNKGRPQPNYRHTRPFVMPPPPPPGNSSSASNGAKAGSHQAHGSSTNLTSQSLAMAPQANSNSAEGNAEKISGKEIPASDGDDGGSLKKVGEGGGNMELNVANQDQKKASDLGDNERVSQDQKVADSSEAKVVDKLEAEKDS